MDGAKSLQNYLHLVAPPTNLDDQLSAMAPNTFLTRAVAWNSWCATCTENNWPPHEPTKQHVLEHVRAICNRSDRPRGSVNNFFALVRMLSALVPSPWRAISRSLGDNNERAYNMAIEGIVRSGTSRPRHVVPPVDVGRVLDFVRACWPRVLAEALPSTMRAADTPPPRPEGSERQLALAAYRQLRDFAIVGIAAVVPSRPSELATLLVSDITIHLPVGDDAPFGAADLYTTADKMTNEDLYTLAHNGVSFSLVFTLRRSKTDQEMVGIPKRLEHQRGDEWSPARAVVCALLLRATALSSDDAPFYTTLFCTASDDNYARPLAADTISNILATITKRATGQDHGGGRAWRTSAAVWLEKCGVSTVVIAALGGWSSERMLIKHYMRSVPRDNPLHQRVLGGDRPRRDAPDSSAPTVVREPPPPAFHAPDHNIDEADEDSEDNDDDASTLNRPLSSADPLPAALANRYARPMSPAASTAHESVNTSVLASTAPPLLPELSSAPPPAAATAANVSSPLSSLPPSSSSSPPPTPPSTSKPSAATAKSACTPPPPRGGTARRTTIHKRKKVPTTRPTPRISSSPPSSSPQRTATGTRVSPLTAPDAPPSLPSPPTPRSASAAQQPAKSARDEASPSRPAPPPHARIATNAAATARNTRRRVRAPTDHSPSSAPAAPRTSPPPTTSTPTKSGGENHGVPSRRSARTRRPKIPATPP